MSRSKLFFINYVPLVHEVMASGRLCYNYKNTSIAHVQKVWRSWGWGSRGRDEGDGNSSWGVHSRRYKHTWQGVHTPQSVHTWQGVQSTGGRVCLYFTTCRQLKICHSKAVGPVNSVPETRCEPGTPSPLYWYQEPPSDHLVHTWQGVHLRQTVYKLTQKSERERELDE